MGEECSKYEREKECLRYCAGGGHHEGATSKISAYVG
jgi:hypothetical protein